MKFDIMAFCKSILGKISSISSVMMVFVLVVSQIGMSHAMAAMHDQGSNHAVSQSAKAHTEVHSGKQLDELSLEQLKEIHSDITALVFDVLSVESSVSSRKSFGGTAPESVLAQVKYWKARLGT